MTPWKDVFQGRAPNLEAIARAKSVEDLQAQLKAFATRKIVSSLQDSILGSTALIVGVATGNSHINGSKEAAHVIKTNTGTCPDEVSNQGALAVTAVIKVTLDRTHQPGA